MWTRSRVRWLSGFAALALAATATAAQTPSGRYKKDGDLCVWDAKDSGPNQCTPRVKGRFKKSGETCVWDVKDVGADQCRPAKGRFKTDGSKCVWDANDSGTDQCNPRQPRSARAQ